MMKQNSKDEPQASATVEQRMKFSMRDGAKAWFDVDGMIISVWISSWSGRAIVRVENKHGQRVVSDKRTFRMNEQHEFRVGKTTYRVDIKQRFRANGGDLELLLYREDELIDSDVYTEKYIETRYDPETGKFDWPATIKAELNSLSTKIAIAVGAVTGAVSSLYFLLN